MFRLMQQFVNFSYNIFHERVLCLNLSFFMLCCRDSMDRREGWRITLMWLQGQALEVWSQAWLLLPAKMTARNLCARHKKYRNSITSTPAKSSRVGSKSLEAKSHQRASFQQMLVDKNNTKIGWFCYCALLMEECSQQKSTEKKFFQSRIVVQGTSSSSQIFFVSLSMLFVDSRCGLHWELRA